MRLGRYNLTLSAIVGKRLEWDVLQQIVQQHIVGAKLLSSAGSEIAFQLPLQVTTRLSGMQHSVIVLLRIVMYSG
jgi:hypothetical protein